MTKLIGRGSNQIPLNSDLGTMAFMNWEDMKSSTVSVESYVRTTKTDQIGFQKAIDSLPDYAECTIYVPYIGRDYTLTESLKTGNRTITWILDDQAHFGTLNGQRPLLNGIVIQNRVIGMRGMSNLNNACNMSLLTGPGAVGNMQSGISGFNPDTVEAQAYNHERGRAALYLAAGDGSDWQIPSASYTSNSFTLTTPLAYGTSSNPAEEIKVGMYVDVPGVMLPGGAAQRYTSRITAIVDNDTHFLGAIVEPWMRATSYTASVEDTPADLRPLVINPHNKIWTQHNNLYIKQTEGATYGHTSGCWIESGVYNATGEDFGTEFARDDHPSHFWGYDASHIVDVDEEGALAAGGGIGFIVRGKNSSIKWSEGFTNRGSHIGFHNYAGIGNDQADAFVASSAPKELLIPPHASIDCYLNSSFVSRINTATGWDEFFRVDGRTPNIDIGRRKSASTPKIKFFASGSAEANTELYDGSIYSIGGTAGLWVNRNSAADANNATILNYSVGDVRKAYVKSTANGISFEGGDIGFGNNTLLVDDSTNFVGIKMTPTAHLTIGGTNPAIRLADNSSATEYLELKGDAVASKIIHRNNTGTALLDISPVPIDGTSNGKIRFFRDTNSTGEAIMEFSRGDGTATIEGRISSLGDTYFNKSSGNVGIGDSSPAAKFHVNSGASNSVARFESTDPSANLTIVDSTSSATILLSAGIMRLTTDTEHQFYIDGAPAVTLKSDSVKVTNSKTPASSSATGQVGEIAWDADYMYVCVAVNTWKRSPITTW